MRCSVELFLSNEIFLYLKKSAKYSCVCVQVDGNDACVIDASSPNFTLSIDSSEHEIGLSLRVFELGMESEYLTSARLDLKDDASLEISILRHENKLNLKLIGHESRGTVSVNKATVKRKKIDCPALDSPNVSPTRINRSFYIPIVLHAFLCIFSLGIWEIVWVFRATQFTNSLCYEEKRDPLLRAVLCALVPFYLVCFNNETARRLDEMAVDADIDSNMLGAWQICTFYLAFVMPIIMQFKMNQLIRAYAKKDVAQGESEIQENGEG